MSAHNPGHLDDDDAFDAALRGALPAPPAPPAFLETVIGLAEPKKRTRRWWHALLRLVLVIGAVLATLSWGGEWALHAYLADEVQEAQRNLHDVRHAPEVTTRMARPAPGPVPARFTADALRAAMTAHLGELHGHTHVDHVDCRAWPCIVFVGSDPPRTNAPNEVDLCATHQSAALAAYRDDDALCHVAYGGGGEGLAFGVAFMPHSKTPLTWSQIVFGEPDHDRDDISQALHSLYFALDDAALAQVAPTRPAHLNAPALVEATQAWLAERHMQGDVDDTACTSAGCIAEVTLQAHDVDAADLPSRSAAFALFHDDTFVEEPVPDEKHPREVWPYAGLIVANGWVVTPELERTSNLMTRNWRTHSKYFRIALLSRGLSLDLEASAHRSLWRALGRVQAQSREAHRHEAERAIAATAEESRHQPKALRAAVEAAFAESHTGGWVESVDCTHAPCLVIGGLHGRTGTSLEKTQALAAYADEDLHLDSGSAGFQNKSFVLWWSPKSVEPSWAEDALAARSRDTFLPTLEGHARVTLWGGIIGPLCEMPGASYVTDLCSPPPQPTTETP